MIDSGFEDYVKNRMGEGGRKGREIQEIW